MDKPIIICLTPVKNESWILERFLCATSLWADHIIIADQQSTDGSQEIAKKFSKVILIENPSSQYDEFHRQKLLIEKAREIPGKKLLITLDADEFFSGNFFEEQEWNSILAAETGTVMQFKWVHMSPDLQHYHQMPFDYPLGFVDDGTSHAGRYLHSPRIPIPLVSSNIITNKIFVMHYGFVNPDRVRSKNRYYMCYELLNNKLTPLSINKQYLSTGFHEDLKPVPHVWLSNYESRGIDMTSLKKTVVTSEIISAGKKSWQTEEKFWWDDEVARFLKQHGTKKFRRLNIWDKNWNQFADSGDSNALTDPRSFFDRAFIRWCKMTANPRDFFVRKMDSVLNFLIH